MSEDAFESGLMWSVYRDMEQEFMEFLDFVPLGEDHRKVHSYKLLRLMLQVGGYVDTAFKEMAFYPKFDENVECKAIRSKVIKGEIATIDHFRETFDSLYGLSLQTVLVKSPKHFASFVDVFNPFLDFKNGRTPKWWTAYNGVKHNWLKNIKEANVENTLEALGGAFLLNVVHEPGLLQLAKRGIALTFDAGFRQVRFADELLTKMIKREHPLYESRIMVDSELFRWKFT